MKKKILGTSDAWSMSHLAYRPSNPVYYIEDCQISKQKLDIARESFLRLKYFPYANL